MNKSATLKTRKPVDRLSPEDLDAFAVWEYATDEEDEEGRDETWVRPVGEERVRMGEYSQLVAATFLTHAGARLRGFMIVTTAKREIELSSGAVIDRGFYGVLPGVSRKEAASRKWSWSIDARDRLVHHLGVKEAQVFPIAFELCGLIGTEAVARTGIIR